MKSKEIYEKIATLLFNVFKSETLKTKIISDEEFCDHTLKLVKGLLFLEQDFNVTYEGNTLSRHFLQVLADLRNENLKVIKDDNWNLDSVDNDYNFLRTYILNIFKVPSEELIKSVELSIEAIKKLSEGSEKLHQKVNANLQSNVVNAKSNDNVVSENSKKEVVSFKTPNFRRGSPQEILLGSALKLPQHPLHNPAFFPFTNKSTNMPILRKILAIMFSVLLAIVVITIVYGFIPKIEIIANGKTSYVYPILISWKVSMWNVLLEVLIYSLLTYTFFKKPVFLRDNYRLPPFTLVLAMIIIISSSMFGVFGYLNKTTFDSLFKPSFQEFVEVDEILEAIWSSTGFQVYRILKIVIAVISIIPILLICYIFSINPRLDRDKLRQADIEYQKALQASLKGEEYQMDGSLFDQDLILENEKDEEKSEKNKV